MNTKASKGLLLMISVGLVILAGCDTHNPQPANPHTEPRQEVLPYTPTAPPSEEDPLPEEDPLSEPLPYVQEIPQPPADPPTDMLRFKEEYETLNEQKNTAGTHTFKTITIPEFNLIRYTTPEEILEIAESGTGLIYFGFPQCPWCRQMTPLLIEVALYAGLDTIHYIDMTEIRTTWILQDGNPIMTDPGHPRYQDLLTAFRSVIEPLPLNPFHLTDSDGDRVSTEELRIFVPTVVAIRDGIIVGSHVYTVPASAPGNPDGNHWNPLSVEEEGDLRIIYEDLIIALLDDCTGFVGC